MPKPVFNLKVVVSKENCWCACSVLCLCDNMLRRTNTIQLPLLHFSFLFLSHCFNVTPCFLKDNWVHVKWTSGSTELLFISSKMTLVLSRTSPAAKIYNSTHGILSGCTAARWNKCKAIKQHISSEVRRAETAENPEPRGVKPTVCVNSSVQHWYSGTMLWSKKEGSLSWGYEWAGWSRTGRMEFPLVETLFDCFLCSVSMWGQQRGGQRCSNESNSVPLNYPIKSAFYLRTPTQSKSRLVTHTLFSPSLNAHTIRRYCLCFCACEV